MEDVKSAIEHGRGGCKRCGAPLCVLSMDKRGRGADVKVTVKHIDEDAACGSARDECLDVFVKSSADATAITMFRGEEEGLRHIANTRTIRVPHVYGAVQRQGSSGAVIVMEFIHSSPSGDGRVLGEQLARLHLAPSQCSDLGSFGFPCETWCGMLKQDNSKWEDDWVTFYRERRIGFQLKEASCRHAHDIELQEKGALLMSQMHRLFAGVDVQPSLLHGDLWAGNAAFDADGPIIYDPAAYYGHHEAELSIMKMFGGYGRDVFEAYHRLIPKEAGFHEREQLYQLYHYLNHYNIFGGSYRHTCIALMEKLLAHLLQC